MAGLRAIGALALAACVDHAFGISNLTWTQARAQADALVAQMTSEEKNNITYGHPGAGCSGQTGSVARLSVPPFCLQDGPAGVRSTDFVSAYAGGISVAASWNKDLARKRGSYMGAEFKRKGNHAALGPVVGPIGRTAVGGRNFEGFGSDPAYLAGKLAVPSIEGLQESVIASVKHFLFNEQEYLRTQLGSREALSTNVDDVTTHELYMWPFQDAVRAGVGSVMCSYNRINNTYASEDYHTLTELLKGELKFPGFVLSDWGSQHSGAASAAGGLDIAMPSSDGLWKDLLQKYVDSGNLTQTRFDDMVARTLAAWYYVIGGPDAPFPASGIGMPGEIIPNHTYVEGRDKASKPTILQGAIEGHVLVKNINNALPLNEPKLLALYGWDATIPKRFHPGPASAVDFEFNYGLESSGLNQSRIISLLAGGNTTGLSTIASAGLLWNGAGSGSNNPSALSDTYSAIQWRARQDDTYLYWDLTGNNVTTPALATACLVFVNELGSEAVDRPNIAAPEADALVNNIASQCRNTIVVIHNPAVRSVENFVNNDNVTAIIYAHFPGQDAGEALAQVLYGEVSPSGRLPYTVPKQPTDFGKLLNVCVQGDANTSAYCDFTEGIYTDYRYFLKNKIQPQYAFGYGLTYSQFDYSDFSVSWVDGADRSTSPPNPSKVAPGGIESLFDVIATATVKVTNSGQAEAADVPQLYVHFPTEQQEVHFLRGFEKVNVQPCGGSTTVKFELTRRDLSRWNTVTQSWELPSGDIEFRLGKSAAEIVSTKTLSK